MSESSNVHESMDASADGEHGHDERSPEAFNRAALLRDFLFQANDARLKNSEQVADYIVTSLRPSRDEWSVKLQTLKVDMLDFNDEQIVELKANDILFAKLYGALVSMKGEGQSSDAYSHVRRAMFELLDLRAGVLSRFDRSQLMVTDNEDAWFDMVDKLIPGAFNLK